MHKNSFHFQSLNTYMYCTSSLLPSLPAASAIHSPDELWHHVRAMHSPDEVFHMALSELCTALMNWSMALSLSELCTALMNWSMALSELCTALMNWSMALSELCTALMKCGTVSKGSQSDYRCHRAVDQIILIHVSQGRQSDYMCHRAGSQITVQELSNWTQ